MEDQLQMYVANTLSKIELVQGIDEAELKTRIMPEFVGGIKRLVGGASSEKKEVLLKILIQNNNLPLYNANVSQFVASLEGIRAHLVSTHAELRIFDLSGSTITSFNLDINTSVGEVLKIAKNNHRIAEEYVVSVGITLMTLNIHYQQLSTDDHVEFKGKIQDILAKSASVDQAAVSAVSVGLCGDNVEMHCQIQTPDANSAESIKKSMNENDIAEDVEEAANSIPGVKAAATGEMKVTSVEMKTEPYRYQGLNWRTTRLLLAGTELLDHRTLASYGIVQGQHVDLTMVQLSKSISGVYAAFPCSVMLLWDDGFLELRDDTLGDNYLMAEPLDERWGSPIREFCPPWNKIDSNIGILEGFWQFDLEKFCAPQVQQCSSCRCQMSIEGVVTSDPDGSREGISDVVIDVEIEDVHCCQIVVKKRFFHVHHLPDSAERGF